MTDEPYPKLDEVGEDDLPTITDSIKSKLRKRIMDELDGYINEAEHQDGYGYWGQFKTYDEAVNDFGLYLTMILPPVSLPIPVVAFDYDITPEVAEAYKAVSYLRIAVEPAVAEDVISKFVAGIKSAYEKGKEHRQEEK